MIGAIIGDIAGSIYEFNPWQGVDKDMPLFTDNSSFTDDTVLSIALADALLEGKRDVPGFAEKIHAYGNRYPDAGYGGKFRQWLKSVDKKAYNSFGNGAAMRVSPIGWVANNLAEVRELAKESALCTHNHPRGVASACAVAEAIFLARTGADKDQIRNSASGYGYDMNRTVNQIREAGYGFSELAEDSVPEAIIAFLDSDNFEEAIRNAIWLRGDADTQAAVAGSIAEAFYGVPQKMEEDALKRLDPFLLEKVKLWQKSIMTK